MDLDEKDVAVLNVLLADARLSYREIARKSGLAVATVISRVQALTKEGIIMGYGVDLDYEKLGYDIQALVHMRVSKGKLFEVERKIATHPNVYAVYDTTGNYDAVILARFKSRKSLDAFLKKIQTYDFVERTETALVLNTIKERSIPLQ